MGVELVLFGLILVIGAASTLFGLFSSNKIFLFIGAALLIGSGAVLWGGQGLIVNHYYDAEGLIQNTVIPMSDVGLSMLAFALIGFGVLTAFMSAFSFSRSSKRNASSAYHY